MSPNVLEPFVLTHEVLVLDAYLERTPAGKDRRSLTKNLIQDLLRVLRMQPLGPLRIFDAVDARAPGWSFMQPITTSHISGHYFESPDSPNIHIDVYSCKAFDWKNVIHVVHSHLKLADWKGNLIQRTMDWHSRTNQEVSGTGSTIHEEVDLRVTPRSKIRSPMDDYATVNVH